MYKFFIGCDISKAWFDVAFHNSLEVSYLGRFANNTEGFGLFYKAIRCKTKIRCAEWFVCFENTGSYSKYLLNWLLGKGIPCKEANPLKINLSLGLRRGKSDKADAQDICQYAFEKRDSIAPTQVANKSIERLKKLISRRDLLVRKRAAIETSLKEQKDLLDADLADLFSSHNDQLIALLTQQITHIELLITQTLDQDEQMKVNAELAQSVIGIGPVITSYVIAYTDNFTKFNNARAFCSYIGVAPFRHGQSGKFTGRNKVSNLANKRIKALVSNGSILAKTYDPGLRNYYNRKIKEGKPKGLVLNAIKNKMMHRLFAVVNRQEKYVKLSYA